MFSLATLGVLAKKYWWVIALILALSLVVYKVTDFVGDYGDDQKEAGATTERNKQLEGTIKNVEKANEAEKSVQDPGPTGDLTRYNQCLRTARTPENCKRWLPDVQTPER